MFDDLRGFFCRHANEEIPDGFSSEDEDLGRSSMIVSLNDDFRPIDEEQEQRAMFGWFFFVIVILISTCYL